MARYDDAFPSNFLKAEDLPQDRDTVVVIDKVTKEILGQGRDAESKFVVAFQGKNKTLVLNKTNFKSIVSATGKDDTDDWPGSRIALFATDVEYQGEMVLAIRVRPRPPAPAQSGGRDAAPVQPKPAPKSEDLDSSDIPF